MARITTDSGVPNHYAAFSALIDAHEAMPAGKMLTLRLFMGEAGYVFSPRESIDGLTMVLGADIHASDTLGRLRGLAHTFVQYAQQHAAQEG